MSMSTQKAINYVEKDKKDYSERKQQVDCLIEISEEALEKTLERGGEVSNKQELDLEEMHIISRFLAGVMEQCEQHLQELKNLEARREVNDSRTRSETQTEEGERTERGTDKE